MTFLLLQGGNLSKIGAAHKGKNLLGHLEQILSF